MLLHPKPADAALLAALRRDFSKYGELSLSTLRQNRPHDYLKIAALLLGNAPPLKPFDGVSNDELAALLTAVRNSLAAPDGHDE